jgi:hypothetical protein
MGTPMVTMPKNENYPKLQDEVTKILETLEVNNPVRSRFWTDQKSVQRQD